MLREAKRGTGPHMSTYIEEVAVAAASFFTIFVAKNMHFLSNT